MIVRQEENEVLEDLYSSARAEFLAIYGRRRVGKTYLVREFFQNKRSIFFNVTGTKDGPLLEQLTHFVDQLSEVFYKGLPLQSVKTWDAAFRLLTKAVSEVSSKTTKIILFFDELPWMATRNSRLLESLDYYWNQHWSNNKRIKLIICGSSASWIINKVINNKGGLHNRITRQIHLEPFNLTQTKLFLEKKGIKLGLKHIVQIYMVMGGIPYYLSYIEKGLSAQQIIKRLAFSKNSFLINEFDNLFSSLFDNSDNYVEIVKIIAEHHYGIGERRLLELIGKHAVGGSGKKRLNDLEQTGFIYSFKPLFYKKKGTFYRLSDEYVMFYLQWLAPMRDTLAKSGLDQKNWEDLQKTPQWYTWLGYAFETICYKHVALLRNALKISSASTPGTWRYVPTKNTDQRGAQIDLLFDRVDDAITLCEIKYTSEPFILTKEYVDNLKQKIAIFKGRTNTKKQIFLTMISASGLKDNYYAQDLISATATLEDLFEQ
jgi:AAA+ ATPase superfamily predicted ATPase